MEILIEYKARLCKSISKSFYSFACLQIMTTAMKYAMVFAIDAVVKTKNNLRVITATKQIVKSSQHFVSLSSGMLAKMGLHTNY